MPVHLQAHHPPPSASNAFLKSSSALSATIRRSKKRKPRTCFVIGNSYGHVLHAHLFNPELEEMTRRFAQVGQNSMMMKAEEELMHDRFPIELVLSYLSRTW